MVIPPTLLYSQQHLWTSRIAEGLWQAGITDYAQDLLGDIVFIDAPQVGRQLIAGTACGLVESVKTGSDLHALVDGVVVEVNASLMNMPEFINDKPYEAWIFKFKPAQENIEHLLLSAEAYKTLINEL